MFLPKKVGGDFECAGNKNLGSLQTVTNFKKIYQAHLDCVRSVEYEKINGIINKDNGVIKKNKI